MSMHVCLGTIAQKLSNVLIRKFLGLLDIAQEQIN
jgi:hypothetical protein